MINKRDSRVTLVHGCFPGGDSFGSLCQSHQSSVQRKNACMIITYEHALGLFIIIQYSVDACMCTSHCSYIFPNESSTPFLGRALQRIKSESFSSFSESPMLRFTRTREIYPPYKMYGHT